MSKEYVGVIVVIKDNQLEEITPLEIGDVISSLFLGVCRRYVSNFDEYTSGDIETIVNQGYERFGNGSVTISLF